MIWRSLICFSLAALPAWCASISGAVVLRDSHLDAVNRKKDYSGVVVYAQAVGSQPAPVSTHATMLQKNKTFTPHILPVQTGTTVDFPNADPIFHNAFSSYNGRIFDVGLYPPGDSRSVRMTRPGIVRVFCNIHSTMSAIILVVNTPYFVKTAMNGSFELNVPPGEYDLSVFHERASEQELSGLTRRVLVPDSGLQIPPIMISEAGYLVAPHKNKYGHEYPPTHDDDQVFYPGVRN
jgi:plastocyanin